MAVREYKLLVVMNEREKARLEEMAQQEECSRGQMIRILVKQEAERRARGE